MDHECKCTSLYIDVGIDTVGGMDRERGREQVVIFLRWIGICFDLWLHKSNMIRWMLAWIDVISCFPVFLFLQKWWYMLSDSKIWIYDALFIVYECCYLLDLFQTSRSVTIMNEWCTMMNSFVKEFDMFWLLIW